MFCPYCGTKNPDEAAFCCSCGAKLPGAAPKPAPQPEPVSQPAPAPQSGPIPQPASQPQPWAVPQPQPYNPYPYNPVPAQKKSHTGLIVGLVLAAVAVFIGIVTAVILLLRPWDSSVKSKSVEGGDVAVRMLEAYIGYDVDAILDLLPDDFYEVMAEESDMTVREVKEYMGDILEMTLDEMGDPGYDPDKAKLKVTVTGDAAYSKSRLAKIRDAYEELHLTIDDAKLVIVDMTATYEGEKNTRNDVEVPLVKVGRKWYMDFNSMDAFAAQFE